MVRGANLRARSVRPGQVVAAGTAGRDCEAEAWRAGVDAFLCKPEGLPKVSQMVARHHGGQDE